MIMSVKMMMREEVRERESKREIERLKILKTFFTIYLNTNPR